MMFPRVAITIAIVVGWFRRLIGNDFFMLKGSGNLSLLPLALLAACSAGDTVASGQPETGEKELVVFAAASLSGAFPELGRGFESANPGVKLRPNFDGSQRLRAQLEFGARAGVFASADERQMALAQEAGVLDGEPAPFAANSLAVAVPAGGEGRNAEVRSLHDLAREGVKLALAQPETPAGRYARMVIQNLAADTESFGASYADRVMSNVVSLETNVRAVVQKVALDEVDAGIVYSTDISGRDAAGKVRAVDIPPEANVAAVYLAAALKGAGNAELAGAFIEYLLSDEAQAILRKRGFGPPPVAGGRWPAAGGRLLVTGRRPPGAD